MYKKLFFNVYRASMVVLLLLLTACEYHEYFDVHGVENGVVYCYSEGQRYEFDLTHFLLLSDSLCYHDAITLDDAVKTANDGFSITRDELIDVEKFGNYEVRTYRYKAYYLVYITSFAHEVYYHHLPFEFEGKELWLKNKPVVNQPLLFEREAAEVTELSLSDDDQGLDSKYLIKFFMNVYNHINGQKISDFTYLYEVKRTNETVWSGNAGDITVTVTYDWKP